MKTNNSQKDSSSEWQQVKLGDIGKVSMCKRIFKDETLSSGQIPFYKISTFGKTADAFISEEIFENYKNKYPYPKKGEILISASGTIGRIVVFNGEKSYFQDSNIIWVSNSENKVLNSFLEKVYSVTKWKSTDGGIISRLYNDDLRSIRFLLPPLPEQNRIVSVLETWDKTIEKLAQKIEVKKQIKKGLMDQFVRHAENTTEYNINDLFELGRGRVIARGEIEKNRGVYPVYSSQTSNDGIFGNIDTFDFDGEYLTWTTDGANAGRVFYRTGKFNCTNVCGTAKLKEDLKVNLYFVYSYLNYITKNYVSYVGNPKLMNGVFGKIQIKLPEIEEQNKITEILKVADEEITGLEKKLSFIKDQKKYLLNNLITGTIRTPETLSAKLTK